MKTGYYLQTLTCYTLQGDLYAYQTGERIRKATKQEVALSDAGDEGTGAFAWSVSRLTLQRKCPILWAHMNGGDDNA